MCSSVKHFCNAIQIKKIAIKLKINFKAVHTAHSKSIIKFSWLIKILYDVLRCEKIEFGLIHGIELLTDQ